MRKKVKLPGIYLISSIMHPDRVYVGSAINTPTRKWRHFNELEKDIHCNSKMQRHVNKYGIDDLTFSIVEPCLPELLIQREQYYIDTLNPYFNECKVAGSILGVKRSIETIEKMSRGKMGDNNPMFGVKQSPETIEKRASQLRGRKVLNIHLNPYKFKKGIPSPRKGQLLSEEHIQHQKEAWALRRNKPRVIIPNIKPSGRSQYIGVSYNGKYIRGSIKIKGKRINLGNFLTEEAAAKAYDVKAKEVYGEFANLNFKL